MNAANVNQPPEQRARGRRWPLAAAAFAVVLVVGLAALSRLPGVDREPATLAAAGLPDVVFSIVGESRVVEVEGGHFKESLLTVQGEDLRGTGSLLRVADQVQGRPVECLGELYDNPAYWMSTTSGAGEIDFYDAGAISLSVTIVEVMTGELAAAPVCQEIVGTYAGARGALADVAGTFTAGIGPGRPQFWTFDS